MSQLVYMPVRCVDKFCEHCNELEIEVDRSDYFTADGVEYGRENHIYCKHWKKCAAIEKKIEENLLKKGVQL